MQTQQVCLKVNHEVKDSVIIVKLKWPRQLPISGMSLWALEGLLAKFQMLLCFIEPLKYLIE